MFEFMFYYFSGSLISLIFATIFNRFKKVEQNKKHVITLDILAIIMLISWLGLIVLFMYIILTLIKLYLNSYCIRFVKFVENRK